MDGWWMTDGGPVERYEEVERLIDCGPTIYICGGCHLGVTEVRKPKHEL